jgi:hypothetical protein
LVDAMCQSLLILVLITLGFCDARDVAQKHYYSEGGSFPLPSSNYGNNNDRQFANNAAPPLYYDSELNDLPQGGEMPSDYEDARDAKKRERLERILNELQQARVRELDRESTGGRGVFVAPGGREYLNNEPQDYQNDVEDFQRHQIASRNEEELEQLQKFGNSLSSLANSNDETVEETKEVPSYTVPASQPLSAAKKGQSEYVEFMEPRPANQLRQPATLLEKRVPADMLRSESYQSYNFLANSGNVLFLAFITMCCVLTAVGMVGGVYYYNRIRAARDDPFDDFTRYSPAGPGRDKLKKGHLSGNGTAGFGGEINGDDSLAYKAQLHHYQQTKQKIIGADLAASTMPPDQDNISDDEADLEHNFSVYECPGLAPTGDIEVQNPNFVGNGEKPASQN